MTVGGIAGMTVQGAALSPLIGGWIARESGYGATFMILGSFALGPVAWWLGLASTLRPACARRDDSSPQPTATMQAAAG